MTVKAIPKWHYFNETDEACIAYNELIDDFILFTACRRDVADVCRHTELKSQVTCVKCLKTLNEIEGE